MSARQDIFGSPDQQALLGRGRALHDLTHGNAGYTYYGRTVGIVSPDRAPFAELVSMTRLQGASHFAHVQNDQMPALVQQLKPHDLSAVQYARWVGDASALQTARDTVTNKQLPNGITSHWLTDESDNRLRASLASAALACGVLPPNLAVLSGALQPGLCRMAVTDQGEVVSCAAAASYMHADHPDGQVECWWGMLSTVPDWRGFGLSLRLGAEVMLEMARRYGFTRFFTGIEPGNTASEVVCTRLGLTLTDSSTLSVADPGQLSGGRMTK
ncbi:N-acetyltransferase [Roseobacter litoralis]|uniref:N-acetyltransferase n=1 Tax=Roseobacter litoralis TaxID=42443 RepID=UPI002493EB22|nr:N-acetyltransferase [Roseobacter litoralis]